MKVHLRFDESNNQHSKLTIFVNGKNSGQLCMSPDEADWFYFAVERGCKAISPAKMKPCEFVGSGSHRPDQPIPPLP